LHFGILPLECGKLLPQELAILVQCPHLIFDLCFFFRDRFKFEAEGGCGQVVINVVHVIQASRVALSETTETFTLQLTWRDVELQLQS